MRSKRIRQNLLKHEQFMGALNLAIKQTCRDNYQKHVFRLNKLVLAMLGEGDE